MVQKFWVSDFSSILIWWWVTTEAMVSGACWMQCWILSLLLQSWRPEGKMSSELWPSWMQWYILCLLYQSWRPVGCSIKNNVVVCENGHFSLAVTHKLVLSSSQNNIPNPPGMQSLFPLGRTDQKKPRIPQATSLLTLLYQPSLNW